MSEQAALTEALPDTEPPTIERLEANAHAVFKAVLSLMAELRRIREENGR